MRLPALHLPATYLPTYLPIDFLNPQKYIAPVSRQAELA